MQFDVETGTDHTTFVESTGEVDNNLACSVVVDNFKFANISCDDRENALLGEK